MSTSLACAAWLLTRTRVAARGRLIACREKRNFIMAAILSLRIELVEHGNEGQVLVRAEAEPRNGLEPVVADAARRRRFLETGGPPRFPALISR